MHLLWILFNQNPQMVYQLLTLPFAVLFNVLATQGYLTLTNRYISLTLGGVVLAVLTMGPYSLLLFVSTAVLALLVHFMEPVHIHQWIFGLQMCWQTFWHFYMQYQQYWLQETVDYRLLLAMSALMLLSQKVTSVSLDIQEGKITGSFGKSSQSQSSSLIPFISYTLYFPALLGGPLCPFATYRAFIEEINIRPPPSPLAILPWKILRTLALLALRYLLSSVLQLSVFTLNSPQGSPGLLWLWILSLILRLNYYSHWEISECLNNAAGLGFSGLSQDGGAVWDGLSDGDPWEIETSTRVSIFARRWNGTTAAWLRRLVYHRFNTAPLFMTFGFSAWWHGLYPGQIVGFLGWAIAVIGDYKLHTYIQPRLITPWRKKLYTWLSWVYTQMVIACVVLATELQRFDAVMWLCNTHIAVVPLASVLFLFIL
ncbi:ghrelin O-acyltransferase-like [Hoplias malabaricus]|uniref:ghrelin O-acyltransferase-like n=1 Tax=Hoplias malabaricus TaxID=27720 RepID=UPI00346348D2